MKKYYLYELLTEYKEKNINNLYKPVAVGKYGIRKRTEIYKKALAGDYSKNKLIYKDTLTIGLGSNQIDIGILEEDNIYSVSPAYTTFKINTTLVKSTYLNFYFKVFNNFLSKKYLIASARQGKKVDIDNLLLEQISIPKFTEQEKIVKILNFLCSIQEKQQQQLQKLDELIKSKFIEMFGESLEKAKYKILPLGNLITTLTDYHANGSYKILKEHVKLLHEPNFALMVRTTDLETNNYTENVNYIDEQAYNFLEKSKIFGGEIIINKIGSAGNVYLMPFLNRPVSLGMNAFLLRFNNRLNNIYAYYILTTKYVSLEIKKRVTGAVTKTITKESIREIPIIVPPIEKQNKFVNLVEKTKKLRDNIQKQIDLYTELLNKKMDEYFN